MPGIYKKLAKDRTWLWLTLTGLLMLSVSMVVNYFASRYANASVSNPVSDIVLSNIRVFDVDGIFIYGGILLCLSILLLVLTKPASVPLVSKSIALFVLIRSIFITLTHLNIFPTHSVIEAPKLFSLFTDYGDLFFSGHTGLPLLIALIFWPDKLLRFAFIGLSVFFGAVVLMGHLHYSIDVLGAFFITPTIYRLALRLFKRDKLLLDATRNPG